MLACFPNPQAIPQPVTWVGVVVVPPGGGPTMDSETVTMDDTTQTMDSE